MYLILEWVKHNIRELGRLWRKLTSLCSIRYRGGHLYSSVRLSSQTHLAALKYLPQTIMWIKSFCKIMSWKYQPKKTIQWVSAMKT